MKGVRAADASVLTTEGVRAADASVLTEKGVRAADASVVAVCLTSLVIKVVTVSGQNVQKFIQNVQMHTVYWRYWRD